MDDLNDPFALDRCPAIATPTETLTSQDVAERVRARAIVPRPEPVAITPRLDLDSVLELLALIHARQTFVTLHPSLSGPQREQRTDAIRSAIPVADREADLAWVFTSGTTGQPKLARLSRRAFIASARSSAEHLGYGVGERWLLSLPPAHVGGLSVITRMWATGGTIVLSDASNAGALLHAVRELEVTSMSMVPTTLARVLRAWPSAPRTLRRVLVGGAACPPALLQRAREFGLPVHATYGLTEACSQVATERTPGAGMSVLPTASIRVVDGRIEVASETMFSGYVGYPPPPEFFPTGDLGTLEDGLLLVLGRRHDLIVTGGENVYPAMLEAALAQRGITACVFGIDDDEWGQQVAVVTEGEHREAVCALNAELARHEQLRFFASVRSLPRLGIGKIDRAAVRKISLEALSEHSVSRETEC